MKIRVLAFAGVRDRLGRAEVELELPGQAMARDVPLKLGLGDFKSPLRFAVNLEYAPGETRLKDGDEVALIPPVAGG